MKNKLLALYIVSLFLLAAMTNVVSLSVKKDRTEPKNDSQLPYYTKADFEVRGKRVYANWEVTDPLHDNSYISFYYKKSDSDIWHSSCWKIPNPATCTESWTYPIKSTYTIYYYARSYGFQSRTSEVNSVTINLRKSKTNVRLFELFNLPFLKILEERYNFFSENPTFLYIN